MLREPRFDKDTKDDLRNSQDVGMEFRVQIISYKKTASFFETFILYTIETSGDFRPYFVERRYNDFKWLFQRLVEHYPMAIIPPIPVKHDLTTIERFAGEFVQHRQRALNKFLQRLTDHCVLGLDKEFWSFLTMLPAMFNQYKKERPVKRSRETLWRSINNLSIISVTGSEKLTSHNPSFKKLAEDCVKSSNTMKKINRVVKRTEDIWLKLSKTLQESEVFSKNNVTVTLDDSWRTTLPNIGEQCKKIADSINQQLDSWIVESVLYWSQVEQVARRRDEAESRFTTNIMTQENQDHSSFEINTCHDQITMNNEELRSGLDLWLSQRNEETREWLKVFADIHINHYKVTSLIWKQMVTSMHDNYYN